MMRLMKARAFWTFCWSMALTSAETSDIVNSGVVRLDRYYTGVSTAG
jgi:hypothetical protein